MFKRKLAKVIVSLLRRIANLTRAGAKRLMRAMLRSLMAIGRRARLPVAGFVLPTVTMVLLVVILLTVAITLRSFDRAQNARNVRVNQQVLAAATPALDRAQAKIEYLLTEDPSRPTGTPSDQDLNRAFSKPASSPDSYTFQDEVRLKLSYPLKRNTIDASKWDVSNPNLLENIESTDTAWRFPVDTNNNGKFDSFTVYGVYFRSPPRDQDASSPSEGNFLVARKPLEARTPPMSGEAGGVCAGALGTSAGLVGDSGWYKSDTQLKKSFFVYTATVPITNTSALGLDLNKYEDFKGDRAFSALEYQQDAARIPLLNNAVVYEDDLEISPGTAFRLNGAMLTNSNLIVTSTGGSTVDFYQVSGENSCFYKQEFSKIYVAGNVVNGWSGATDNSSVPITVHLYQGKGADKIDATIQGSSKQSVSNNALEVLYNTKAYGDRISALVKKQIEDHPGAGIVAEDPKEVQDAVAKKVSTREDALQNYFAKLTRKVPFKEVPFGDTTLVSGDITGTGDQLRPTNIQWSLPTGDAKTGASTDYAGLSLNTAQLEAQLPSKTVQTDRENYLGDRVLVGNNLPLKWWDESKNNFLQGTSAVQEIDGSTAWKDCGGGSECIRTRTSQRQIISGVGTTDRNGFWEQAAAQRPQNALSGYGGLRVITGAGVYGRKNSFLPPPRSNTNPADLGSLTYDDPTTSTTETYPMVWPDSMPMSPSVNQIPFDNVANKWDTSSLSPTSGNAAILDLNTLPASAYPSGSLDPNTKKYAKGDLLMRATVVYHYAQDSYDANVATPVPTQRPIACISSYYDPSYRYTPDGGTTWIDSSKNMSGLPHNADSNGKSHNGIVYSLSSPDIISGERPGGSATPAANGVLPVSGSSPEDATSIQEKLYYQANLVFPDGRFANGPLREALMKAPAERTLADESAIDSTVCALKILDGSLAPSDSVIGHGAIKEVAFLNAREIKAIDADDPNTPVDETFTLSSPTTTSPALPPTAQASARLTGNYDLSIEERMPLEIRVTQLDLDQLRNKTIALAGGIPGPSPEFMLPNSGLIYASRDDALPDRSDRTPDPSNVTSIPYGIDSVKSKITSSKDSLLDPTRRPNGIMLVNGRFLARNDDDKNGHNNTPPTKVADVVKEKGLILVSNNPAYVQADSNNLFNQHNQQEFSDNLVQPSWSNFYDRSGPPFNPNFACREKDPRISNCTQGDTWRPASILADSVTLLSNNFTFGFRNEGDFDLRNNAGSSVIGYDFNNNGIIGDDSTSPPPPGSLYLYQEATYDLDLNGDGDKTDTVKEIEVTAKAARLLNGFFANNYVTNGLSSLLNFIKDNYSSSSYSPFDFQYSYNSGNPRNSSYFNNFVSPVQRRSITSSTTPEYVMEICRKIPVSACGPDDWVIGYDVNDNNISDDVGFYDIDEDGTLGAPKGERLIKAYQFAALNSTYYGSGGFQPEKLMSGTTALPAKNPGERRFPRRVSFLRWNNATFSPKEWGNTLNVKSPSSGSPVLINTPTTALEKRSLVLIRQNVSDPWTPIPLGIPFNKNNVRYYPYYKVNINGDKNNPASPPAYGDYEAYSLGTSGTKIRPVFNSLVYRTIPLGTTNNPSSASGWTYTGSDPLAYRTRYTSNFTSDDPSLFSDASGSFLSKNTPNVQPFLVPVLQLHVPKGGTPVSPGSDITEVKKTTRWLPPAVNSTFNLVIAGGDTPSRAITQNGSLTGDFNGGLQNLPRFIENWYQKSTTIVGSFIQLERSRYATAPYQAVIGDTTVNGGVYSYRQGYRTDNNRLGSADGRSPSFSPPDRQWGYDVGLLSQPPDLFAQQFTIPTTNRKPNEFFREVGRDDLWVKTLLCAVQADNTSQYAVNLDQLPGGKPDEFCTNPNKP